MGDIHLNVLRSNHQLLVDKLELRTTQVLDCLFEEGTISAGEQEDILSYRVRRDQNSRLLFLLKRRKKSYSSFYRALEQDYGFICDKLTESETCARQDLTPEVVTSCMYCLLLQNLIPSDVTHGLYQDHVISDDDLQEINSREISRSQAVKILIQKLCNSQLPQTLVQSHFLQRLQLKYSYIVENIKETKLFSCHCDIDVSTSSATYPCISYSKSKEDLDHRQHGVNINAEHVDSCEDASLHTGITVRAANEKRKIKFRRRSNTKITDTTSLELIVQEYPSPVKQVPKSFPKDKKLMRLCSKLWDKLFTLRERGDWDHFRKVSFAARAKYCDRPDIQMLLHRSDMCVSTFYKDDRDNALESFKNALDILPSTSMPDWHLARLLPLKIELFTRSKQFDEASALLKDAHQAMCTLTPCLSSGAVYFFEAIYLSSILQCTQGGTKSMSIRDRVKTCFLTAIQHYQQEKYFNIRSFLQQVYLFLALFSLGIEVKRVDYVTDQASSYCDVDLAEYYLNLFENRCWDDSTDWSRMLFYVARAEQHRQRDSLRRSLDYWNQAKICADIGKFEQHKCVIVKRISVAEQRLSEKLQVRDMIQLKGSRAEDILADLDLSSSSDSC